MPCESLDRFWETEICSRACGDCPVLTFSGRGVTTLLVSKPSIFQNSCVVFLSPVDIGYISISV